MKRTRNDFVLKSIEDVERIEKLGNVSERYVPIYTSELIKFLEPEFKFVSGYKFGGVSSKHYVILENEDGDKIKIYNSFDRSFALRIYLASGDVHFSVLDDYRVIHVGEKARLLGDKDHLKDIKESILKGIPVKKMMINKLKTVEVQEDIQEAINKLIAKDKIYHMNRKKECDYKYINPVDEIVKKLKENGKKMSIYDYINLSITNFLDGNYEIEGCGEIKKGRKNKSVFYKVQTINKISQMIEKDFIEYLV